MDEARITMEGKWWCNNDPQKQDFTLKCSEKIPAFFYCIIDGKNIEEEVILDLKQMKIRRKSEEECVTNVHGDRFKAQSYKYE